MQAQLRKISGMIPGEGGVTVIEATEVKAMQKTLTLKTDKKTFDKLSYNLGFEKGIDNTGYLTKNGKNIIAKLLEDPSLHELKEGNKELLESLRDPNCKTKLICKV